MNKFYMISRGTVLFMLMIGTIVLGQQWTAEQEVAPGDSPDMDIDPVTGNVFILSMYNGVTITVVNKNGQFVSRETVDGTATDEGGSRFGAAIAVDQNGYPHICYREYYSNFKYSTFYKRKTAAGWGSSVQLVRRGYRAYMVRMDIDENNVVHIVNGFAYEEDIVGRVMYFRISNGAISRSEELGMSYAAVYRADDRVEIDTYPGGKVHILSGFPNPNGKIYYFYSNDGGETFSAGDNIRKATNQSRSGSPELQVDETGRVHYCYGESDDLLLSEKPSVHYGRIQANASVYDKIATLEDECVPWPESMKIGLGSIGSSNSGQNIVIAYVSEPGGPLSAIYTQDLGLTWSSPERLAQSSGSDDGRNKQIVRGNGNTFYLAYPHSGKVWLRMLTLIVNVNPVANAGGPYTGNEGTAITFNASGSRDTDGSIVKYEWDWDNNGIYDATVTSPTTQRTYPDNYSGLIGLRVTDNEGGTATATANITVNNVAPTANAQGPYRGEKNTDITLTGSATDPGTLDTFTFAWDLDNNGSYESSGQSVTVRFSSGGTYTVKLRVRDDDGGEDVDQTTVSISNEAPQVSTIPGQTINEGGSFTAITLDNYVTDPDNADSEITWSVSGNVNINVAITNRVANLAAKNADWYGSEAITFKATDPGNLSAQTTSTFTVNNVNDAPILSQIPHQTKQEGVAFDQINVDDYVTDVDNSKNELSWQITGNINLTYSWSGHILSVFWPHVNWFGSETLTFTVTDPGGLSSSKTVVFTINNVNDPPVISGLNGQSIKFNETFVPIHLDDVVSYIDHVDAQLNWYTFGAMNLQVTIDGYRIATITRKSPSWSGSETITFVVSDGSLSDSAKAVFVVGSQSFPPVISSIPGQPVGENQKFQPIYLDGYVSDPDNGDGEITWKLEGYEELIVTLQNRIVTIAAPDSEWNGYEMIDFIATDPTGLSDTASAKFTVLPVNDPPKIISVPEYTVLEDDTLHISITFLKSLVFDPDNDLDDFQFELTNLSRLNWFKNVRTNTLDVFSLKTNWYGIENATLIVHDGAGGSDSKLLKITFQSVQDGPLPFSIISPHLKSYMSLPDTIKFAWHRSIDPDQGDFVTYELSLSNFPNFSHVFDSYVNLYDSTYIYRTSKTIKDGTYYWRVKATENHGLYTYSSSGIFSIYNTDVSGDLNEDVPSEYVLEQNFPNPFNPETQIIYHVPDEVHVEISIYNALGQHIRKLESGTKKPGIYKLLWDGNDDFGAPMTSGIYICHLKAGNTALVRKMLLLQ